MMPSAESNNLSWGDKQHGPNLQSSTISDPNLSPNSAERSAINATETAELSTSPKELQAEAYGTALLEQNQPSVPKSYGAAQALSGSLNPEVKPVQTNSLFPQKIIISCITKDKGPLTKIMSLDPVTGEVIKDGSECSLNKGWIKQIEISSPDGLKRFLQTRETNQAIVHGIYPEHKLARVVSKGMLTKAQAASCEPVIARTKDYIIYPDAPGVILFDHDKAKEGSAGSPDALRSYAPADLLAVLAKIHPKIGRAAYVSTPSTSSCIYSAAGDLLRGEGTGSHTYQFVKQASDIPRFLAVLGKRLFLAGLGRIEVSRSGALLERTLVDLMVGSPERLDFVAGAVCRDGLVQKLPPPSVHDGEMLDTTTLLDTTAEEDKAYSVVVQELKNKAKPQQEKVVTEYIDREAGKLAAERGIDVDEARKVVTSRQDHVLEDGDLLYFAGEDGPITVAEVLDAGDKYHGKSLADPLEPDYEGGSKTKAKFYWNEGRDSMVNSFAHGSGKYRFRRFVKESKDATDFVAWAEEDFAELLERTSGDCGAPFEPETIQQLAHLKKQDKSSFMRLRHDLKQANSAVILKELDKDIRINGKKESRNRSAPGTWSTAAEQSENNPIFLNFKGALIVESENGDSNVLVPESEAAALIGAVLKGRFAFDAAGIRWYRFAGSHWQACFQSEFDHAVTNLLYLGAGDIGFRHSFHNGVSSLMQKSAQNRLSAWGGGKIPFLNGLLDLNEMDLCCTTPENAATWVLPFNYDRTATCPNFLKWLYTAVDGDTETITLLRAWINACLTGRADLQVFLHIIGPAGTGKSTFGRIMFTLVGSENATTTSLKQLETNRFEAANIYGKRLVAIEEADKYAGSVNVLKAMTGQDPMRLERKNQQQQGSFIYEGQTLLMSNERLATSDYTSGIERRRVTIEFTRRISPEERAEFTRRGGEAAILHKEAAGIINWALGLSAYDVSATFKKMPELIRAANLAAARFNNPIVDWMLSNLLPDPQAKTNVGKKEEYRGTSGEVLFRKADQWLYPNYLHWCRQTGRESMALQRFSSVLTDAATTYGTPVNKRRGKDGVMVFGLRIRREDEDSWLSLLENENLKPTMKTEMKDNYAEMKEMKTMNTSNHFHMEKKVIPAGCDTYNV